MSRFLPLGEVAQFINGYAFAPEDWHEDGLPIIRIQNLTDGRKPFNRTRAPVPDKYRVRVGDLLVSWSASLGVFEWQGPEEGLVNQHIFRVLPHSDRVDQSYLRHALNGALDDMKQHLHGATMQHVNRGDFLGTAIYLPPLPEQRRIAAILDHADGLRAKRRAALAQLDEMSRAIFVEMFGDPLGSERGTEPSQRVPFEAVTTRITYGFTSPMDHIEAGIPIITAKNVRHGYIDFESVHFAKKDQFNELTNKSKPHFGDILITKDGTIGRCAVVERKEEFCINQSVALVQPDRSRVLPSYIAAYIGTASVQSALKGMGKGNALVHLQITELAKMPIALPSLAAQLKFDAVRSALAKPLGKAVEGAHELDRLFATLQHRAFRGEL